MCANRATGRPPWSSQSIVRHSKSICALNIAAHSTLRLRRSCLVAAQRGHVPRRRRRQPARAIVGSFAATRAKPKPFVDGPRRTVSPSAAAGAFREPSKRPTTPGARSSNGSALCGVVRMRRTPLSSSVVDDQLMNCVPATIRPIAHAAYRESSHVLSVPVGRRR